MKGKIIFNSVIFPDDYLEMITGEPYVIESDYEIYEISSVCEKLFSKEIAYYRADQIDKIQSALNNGISFVPVICRERSLLGDYDECRDILYFVQVINNNPLDNDKDCYYLRSPEIPEVSDALCIYYNPDSVSGGQFVVQCISKDLIKKAVEEMSSISNFFEILDSEACTTLVDKGTKDYEEMVESLSCKIPDFTKDKSTEVQTFSKLIEFACGK